MSQVSCWQGKRKSKCNRMLTMHDRPFDQCRGVPCTQCAAGRYSSVQGKECQACPTGFYRGSSDTNPKRCLACRIGEMTRSEGAISCDTCDLGKHGDPKNLEYVFPANLDCFRMRGESFCKKCDLGKIANKNKTACANPDWETTADCKPGSEFLNDSHSIPWSGSANHASWVQIALFLPPFTI